MLLWALNIFRHQQMRGTQRKAQFLSSLTSETLHLETASSAWKQSCATVVGFRRTPTCLQETVLGPLGKLGDLQVADSVGGKDGCQEQAGCIVALGAESGSCCREGCVLGSGAHACTCGHSDQMWSNRATGP